MARLASRLPADQHSRAQSLGKLCPGCSFTNRQSDDNRIEHVVRGNALFSELPRTVGVAQDDVRQCCRREMHVTGDCQLKIEGHIVINDTIHNGEG